MRNFFQSRSRAHVEAPKANRPPVQASAHHSVREPVDDNIAVSELSELEARALCAREGIPLFWPLLDSDNGVADSGRHAAA